jgi:uncharacterized protein YegP (UPF0339 family)
MQKIFRGLVLQLALVLAVGAIGTGWVSAQKDKDKDKKTEPTSVFEVYKDSADEFRFRLKDGDGDLLATSGKGYKNKADCLKIVEAIRSTAAKAKVEDETKK